MNESVSNRQMNMGKPNRPIEKAARTTSEVAAIADKEGEAREAQGVG